MIVVTKKSRKQIGTIIGYVYSARAMIKCTQASSDQKKKGRWSHVSTVGFPNLVNLASTARTVSMTLTASCG